MFESSNCNIELKEILFGGTMEWAEILDTHVMVNWAMQYKMNVILLVLRTHRAHSFLIIHKSVFISQNDTYTHSKAR